MTMRSFVNYTEMESPMGSLTILATDKGVCKIHFGSIEKHLLSLKAWSKKTLLKDELILNDELLFPIVLQLSEYFDGHRKDFDFQIDPIGSSFQKKVWEALQTVEYGETNSYKQIAQIINAPKAVRAVGGAVNKNPLPIVIPCHRVIGSNGSLVGYNGGLEKKQKLLTIENALEKIS